MPAAWADSGVTRGPAKWSSSQSVTGAVKRRMDSSTASVTWPSFMSVFMSRRTGDAPGPQCLKNLFARAIGHDLALVDDDDAVDE